MPNWCMNTLRVTISDDYDDAQLGGDATAELIEAFRTTNAAADGNDVLSFSRAVPIEDGPAWCGKPPPCEEHRSGTHMRSPISSPTSPPPRPLPLSLPLSLSLHLFSYIYRC